MVLGTLMFPTLHLIHAPSVNSERYRAIISDAELRSFHGAVMRGVEVVVFFVENELAGSNL